MSAYRFGNWSEFFHQPGKVRRRERLKAIYQGFFWIGMNLNEEPVSTSRYGCFGYRWHQ